MRIECRGTPPGRKMLEEALLIIVEHWQLNWLNAADYKALAVIEGSAHELAHALDLGPRFESRIEDMEGGMANAHEAAALRIEVTALTKFGVRLSMHRLRESANWSGTIGIPSLAQLQAPLNYHERSCVQRFVTMVAHEIRFMAKRQKAEDA